MDPKDIKKTKLPMIVASAIFILFLALTQYLTYQQYLILKKKEHESLFHELNNLKDKFRNILYNDITGANTLVILYKEYGYPKNFDSIAQQVMENCKYIDAIQLTKNGIITNVYPLKGYEHTIGLNSLGDLMRQQEAKNALAKKGIFFAGPRKLRQGGYGILGKVPVIANNKLKGYCVVLTKLYTIEKTLGTTDSKGSNFTYSLIKNYGKKDQTEFSLSDAKRNPDSEVVSVEINEGNWQLGAAYSENYESAIIPYKLSAVGFLLSIISALWAYRKTQERATLQKMVREKTQSLNERIKELSTIYKVNDLLLDDTQTAHEIFSHVIYLLPPGWKYPEVCEARIIFEGAEYKTNGYKPSRFSQKANIVLADGRKGELEVIYTEEKPIDYEGPFLIEERNLIDSVAKIIEIYLNKTTQKEQLKQSETRFKIAFDMASIGMAMVGLDGSFQRVNTALSIMFGYSGAELLDFTFQEITYPEDLKKDLELLKLLLTGQKDSYQIEKRFIHKNGSIVWVNLNVAVINDNANNPLYFVAQIENITERIESQIKFRDLVEKTLVGIYIVKDKKIAYVNPQILREYGYTEQDLIGQPIEKLIYEDDLPLAMQKLEERLMGLTDQVRYEVRIKKNDGSLVWNEMFGNSTIYEGGPAVIGTMVNIADKKNFYDELQKSEANIKSVFNSTEVSYLLIDKNFNIISFNKYFDKYQFEQTGEDLQIGMNFIDEVPLKHRKAFERILNRVLTNNTPVEFEKTVHSDNEAPPKYYHFMVSPVKSNGNIIGICVANIEITKQKNLEIERKQIINDLTQRNRDLEQFSYIVSHNMRMPISNLLGLITLLENNITPEDQVFINESIKKSVFILESVVTDVNEILNLRKDLLESKVPIDLNEIIKKIETELQNTINKTQAKITVDFSAANTIYSIPPFIHSIFLNLISNSLKYSQKDVAPIIKVWSETEDKQIKIYFKDNGTGIDLSRYGGKIFGLYKRFDLSREGKGMGLFMVKAQVNALNGKIEVESEPGKGSTFIIILPKN